MYAVLSHVVCATLLKAAVGSQYWGQIFISREEGHAMSQSFPWVLDPKRMREHSFMSSLENCLPTYFNHDIFMLASFLRLQSNYLSLCVKAKLFVPITNK